MHDKKYRYEKQRVIVSDNKVIEEISKKYPPITLLSENPKGENQIKITGDILKKITKLPSFTGDLAEFAMPPFLTFEGADRLLILDGISDPGNMGTLLRSAVALNFTSIYFLPSCSDPFNDKALRSAKGAPFFAKLYMGTHDIILDWASKKKAPLYTATMQGTPLNTVKFNSPFALILGNESRGISPIFKEKGVAISIPMSPSVESLNVAIAGSIIMYKASNA